MAHYFDRRPTARSRPATVELTLPDARLRLRTDRGVFAADGVDPGTKLLLAEGPRPTSEMRTLVDLGCGYGPIALTLALRAPDALVWAIDVNERARALCADNARDAGLSNVRVVAPEEVPRDLTVDGLWSNPPVRVGKAALHALLTEWLARLAPRAAATLVVHRHLGSDSLARWLRTEGWECRRLLSRQGYRVLWVSRAPGDGTPPPEGS